MWNKKKKATKTKREEFRPVIIRPRNEFERKLFKAEEKGMEVASADFLLHNAKEREADEKIEYFNPEYPNSDNSLYIERLVREILKLDRAVEGLVTAGRYMMSQQIEQIEYIFKYMIKPQISGSDEVYEMERMLRAIHCFANLNETEWRRSSKFRKEAIDIMRATTEVVLRRLVANVTKRGQI